MAQLGPRYTSIIPGHPHDSYHNSGLEPATICDVTVPARTGRVLEHNPQYGTPAHALTIMLAHGSRLASGRATPIPGMQLMQGGHADSALAHQGGPGPHYHQPRL